MNYILPHLGMGDYLICNGLIRTLINKKPQEEYILFINDRFITSLKFMFRDIPNLSYSVIPQVEFNSYYILPYIKHSNYHLIIIGYEYLDKSMSSDKSFYKQFNVDFEKRWDNFYVKRKKENELKLAEKLGAIDDWIFVFEDPSRNQLIDRSKLNTNYKVIEAIKGVADNIFDYCYIIENAKEVHCIESSFMFLADSIDTTGELFAHRHARELYDYTIPNMKKKWNILK